MVNSMTAFGRSTGEKGGKIFTCEIRSVNNRFLDLSVRLPRNYGFLEDRIRKYIPSKGISRGKIDIGVTIEVIDAEGVSIEPDMSYAKSYLDALRKLSSELGIQDDVTVSRLAQNRDIFVVRKPDEDIEKEWQTFLPFLDEAIDKFIKARETEGENLKADLLIKKQNIEQMAKLINARSEKNIAEYRTKLETRLKNTLDELDIEVDEARILTECAIFADKIAVDEEMVRLASHLKAFEDTLDSSEPIGRKLDFLVQEINREINTTGSKSNDSEIAKLVVEAKCEVEKIREQIQNIE